jgi:hypothetical protein
MKDLNLGKTKKTYIVLCKYWSGEEGVDINHSFDKDGAEESFRKNYTPYCDILKTQTVDEWINETSMEIVSKLIKPLVEGTKNIRKDLRRLMR